MLREGSASTSEPLAGASGAINVNGGIMVERRSRAPVAAAREVLVDVMSVATELIVPARVREDGEIQMKVECRSDLAPH